MGARPPFGINEGGGSQIVLVFTVSYSQVRSQEIDVAGDFEARATRHFLGKSFAFNVATTSTFDIDVHHAILRALRPIFFVPRIRPTQTYFPATFLLRRP